MSKPTKKVICPAPGCWDRRVHHEQQDTPRGAQRIDVPEDWTPDMGIAFCSLTCAAMAGLRPINISKGTGWQYFIEHWKAEFKLGAETFSLVFPSVDAGWDGPSYPLTITRSITPGMDTDDKKLREGMCWEALSLMQQKDNVQAARQLLKVVAKRIDSPMGEWHDYRTPDELLDEIKERLGHIDWWDTLDDD